LGAELVGNLTRALDQVPLSDIMVGFIVDGVEDFCSIGKEGPKPRISTSEGGTRTPSVEATATMASRVAFVRCVLSDPSSLPFIAAFDSCLSDETLEKYDAVPRTKD